MAGRDRVRKTDPLKNPGRQALTLDDLTSQLVKREREDVEEASPVDPSVVAMTTVNDSGHIVVGGYEITTQGLIGHQPSEDDWAHVGELLFSLEDRIQLLIGDWLVDADRVWGYTYEVIAEQVNRAPRTLYNYKYVAENVPFSLRRENLTYSHYMLVAGLDDYRKQQLIDLAAEHNYSVAQLRREIAQLGAGDTPASPTPLDKLLRNIQKERDFAQKQAKKLDRVGRSQLKQIAQQQMQWWSQFVESLDE